MVLIQEIYQILQKSIDNSMGPKSKPPDSLENGIASQPCSAKSFHFSGSKPDSVLMKFKRILFLSLYWESNESKFL